MYVSMYVQLKSNSKIETHRNSNSATPNPNHKTNKQTVFTIITYMIQYNFRNPQNETDLQLDLNITQQSGYRAITRASKKRTSYGVFPFWDRMPQV